MEQTGIELDKNIKNWLIHVLVVVVLQLIAKLSFGNSVYGFILGMGILFGREVSQAEYRALARGNTWQTLSVEDYLDIENWKAKDGGLLDTVLDILIPFLIGVALWLIIK